MMHNTRPGLIIAYMQARLPAKRARSALARQRRIIEQFQRYHSFPIDLWYARAKGLSPLPTPEMLMEAGKVYAVICSEWGKLRGCEGYWPDIWELCNIYRVRKVCILNQQDFCWLGEHNLFRHEGWNWPKR